MLKSMPLLSFMGRNMDLTPAQCAMAPLPAQKNGAVILVKLSAEKGPILSALFTPLGVDFNNI